uniref:Uncharacterized protein n=1 Tax=Rhizophora mucronata TaxID=61149 RepID=A0A2P2PMP2_RHIMU
MLHPLPSSQDLDYEGKLSPILWNKIFLKGWLHPQLIPLEIADLTGKLLSPLRISGQNQIFLFFSPFVC